MSYLNTSFDEGVDFFAAAPGGIGGFSISTEHLREISESTRPGRLVKCFRNNSLSIMASNLTS